MFFDVDTQTEVDEKVNKVLNNAFETFKMKVKISEPEEKSESLEIKEPGEERFKYRINKIEFLNNDKDEEIASKISKKVKIINSRLESDQFNDGWNIFYFYKEFIQQFKDLGFNFFRGQTNNWTLKPSLCRYEQYNMELIRNFDTIYREIAEQLEEIEYYPFPKSKGNDGIDVQFAKRNTKLGVLQHYGFPTPLVDVTSSPFIALLFMCDEHNSSSVGKLKRLDLFKVNTNRDSRNGVFSSVFLGNNKRIRAQKGEFLDFSKFEYLRDEGETISHIPHIVLELDYSSINYGMSVKAFNDVIKDIANIKKYDKYSKIEPILKKKNIDENRLNQIKLAFNSTESRLHFVYEALEQEGEYDIASAVNKDLYNKLKEYGYTKIMMFPDTYIQLRALREKYILKDV